MDIRIPQDLPSKSFEFLRFAEESKNWYRNLRKKFEFTNTRIRSQRRSVNFSKNFSPWIERDKRPLLLSARIGKIFSCFMPRKCIVWYTNRSIVYEMLSHAGNIVRHERKCNENGKKHCETGYYFRNGSSATNDFLSFTSSPLRIVN